MWVQGVPWSESLEVETSERGGAGGGSLPAEVLCRAKRPEVERHRASSPWRVLRVAS